MPRNTNSELQEIFDTDLGTDSLDRWLGIAESIVDDVEKKDSSLSSSRLKDIEVLVAAHFASSQDPRLSSTSRETASVDYRKAEAYATDYLAAAASLDPTGIVAGLNKPNASVQSVDVKGLESDSY